MATPFSHAIVAIATGSALKAPARTRVWAAALSVLPDIDVVWLPLTSDSSFFGHRMFTHSLMFAGLISVLAVRLIGALGQDSGFKHLGLYLFLAIASHGFLDGFTDAGVGVGLFVPFSYARYFFPFRPLHIVVMPPRTPFRLDAFQFTSSELLWLWLPSILFMLVMRYAQSKAPSLQTRMLRRSFRLAHPDQRGGS